MRSLLFIVICIILIIAGVFVYKNLIKEREEISLEKPIKKTMTEKSLEGKTIAMVIAFRDFRDVEYFIPRDIFSRAGAKVKTVSAQKGVAVGADGGEVPVDLTVDEFQAKNYDAVVFVGGPGMAKNLEKESFHKIARETVGAGKILGAICIAPALLAKAGVLSGKKATVWSSPLDKSPIKILEEEGAIYQNIEVVVDGRIITANGPAAARNFAEAIVEALK
jgi:protease I